MSAEGRRHEGPWRVVPIYGPSLEGTIHDDEEARRHGFRRAIVGGPNVAQTIMPAVAERFGPGWIEGGWMSIKFVGPVYPDERVREVAEPTTDPSAMDVRVEAEDGRVAVVGSVGMGRTEPWSDAGIGTRGPERVFPGVPIGFRFDTVRFSIGEEAVRLLCDSAGDLSPWFRGDSPWGGPVVPPLMAFNPATGPQRDESFAHPVHDAGMNAEFHMVTVRPMFHDREYALRMRVVDKGVGARTWFWTSEFEVTDEDGARCMTGRQKLKWFPKQGARLESNLEGIA